MAETAEVQKDVNKMSKDELFLEIAKNIKSRRGDEYGHQRILAMILERMMSVEDAKIMLNLPGMPADLAPKVKMTEAQVESRLAVLGEKGLAYKSRKGWFFPRNSTQFHDGSFTMPKFHKEYGPEWLALLEAWTAFEYHNPQRQSAEAAKVPYKERGTRVIPDPRAFMPGVEPAPWEDLKGLFDVMIEDGPIGVMPCSCKIALLNDPRTVQDYWTCIVWGRSYEWNNARGTAKTYNSDEMVKAIEHMHDQGLVSKAPNSKNFMATRGSAQMFCQCSATDCGNPNNPPEVGPFPSTSPSRYKMQIKSAKDCQACQACVKMCMFHAAQLKFYPELNTWKAFVDTDRCMGCGNCAIVCPIKNRGLVLARDADHVPDEVPGWFMVEG